MRSRCVMTFTGFFVGWLASGGCGDERDAASGLDGSASRVPAWSHSALGVASVDPELAALDARLDTFGNGCHAADAGTPATVAELADWVRGECQGECPRVICVWPSLLADRATTAALELSRTDCTAAAPCVLRNALPRTAWGDAQQPIVHHLRVTSSHWWVRDLQVNGLAEEAQLAAAPVVVTTPWPPTIRAGACKLSSAQVVVTGADARIEVEDGAGDVTLDRLTVQNGMRHMISVDYGSHSVRVVRSVLRSSVPQLETDLVGIVVGRDTGDAANVGPFAVEGVRILGNEIYDIPGDGIQLYAPDCVASDGTILAVQDKMCVAPPPDYRDARIALNDIYLTAATQDTGIVTTAYPANRPTALAENAIDIKSGSGDPMLPIVLEGNRMWGFRTTATVPLGGAAKALRCGGSGGSDGEAVVIHAPGEEAPLGNIVVAKNLILDAGLGVSLLRQPHVTIEENLIAGIHPGPRDGTAPQGAPMSLSLYAPSAVVQRNVIQSWTQSSVRWIQLHDGVSDVPVDGAKEHLGATITYNIVCGPNALAYFAHTVGAGGNVALPLGKEWVVGSSAPAALEGMFPPTHFRTHGNLYGGGVSRFRFLGEAETWVEDASPCVDHVTFKTRLRAVLVMFGG